MFLRKNNEIIPYSETHENYVSRENYSDQQNNMILIGVLGVAAVGILVTIILLSLRKGKKRRR